MIDAVAAQPGAFARHVPVLRSEALGALGLKPGGVYVDGTFGAGGYASEILSAFPDIRVEAFDRDPDALAAGAPLVDLACGRLRLHGRPFSEMADAGLRMVDGVVLDIGVSSMQVDEAQRGFSFRNDGPLDMRMSQDGPSAADVVNEESEERLADIIYTYGEERLSRPIARGIVAARSAGIVRSTRQLADIVSRAVSRIVRQRPGDIHPATRTFQALRIHVNDELGELARALHAAEGILKPGGALAVVTFHSLEDRIVKQFFAARSGKGGGSRHQPVKASAATFVVAGRWPVAPEPGEIAYNNRARSAKLRAGVRTTEPAAAEDAQVMTLAALPDRQGFKRKTKEEARKGRGRD
jgi:16S rRNA (cytosine1402-N4)-methyltransferase